MTPTRDWLSEFDASYRMPDQILTLVAEGKLDDRSWHNDACPCFALCEPDTSDRYFRNRAGRPHIVTLWVEHPDPEQREFTETSKRFALFAVPVDEDGERFDDDAVTLADTDDLKVILTHIRMLHLTRHLPSNF